MKNIKEIDDKWFYSKTHPILRILQIYVKGDMLVLLPFLLGILVIGLVSMRFMLLVYALYFTFRMFGEMIYWFSQQFGQRVYRPDDLGFAKLNNKAVYVIYQTLTLVGTVLGAASVILLLFF